MVLKGHYLPLLICSDKKLLLIYALSPAFIRKEYKEGDRLGRRVSRLVPRLLACNPPALRCEADRFNKTGAM